MLAPSSVADVPRPEPFPIPLKAKFRSPSNLSHYLARSKIFIPRRCVINPEESPRLRNWDILTALCLVFVCFVSPYEVAFNSLASQAPKADFLFWINRCIDCVFVLDIALQFFVMYPITHRHGTIFVTDHRLIVRHYLRTWFVVDVLSVLPFDVLAMTAQSDVFSRLKLLRVMRLTRLLKLFRLVRGMRMLRRYELEFGISYRKLTLSRLFVVVIVSAHWIACFLGILSSFQGNVCFGPDEPKDCIVTWLTGVATEVVAMGDDWTHWRAYMVSLHTSATILVHPTNGSPTSDVERVCFIALIFIGGFAWTRVISTTTAVITSMSRHSTIYHQTMDDLNSNAAELRLPHPIRRRLRGFFMNTSTDSRQSTWKELVARLSPLLRMEVSYHCHKVWLRRVACLAGAPKLFTSSLTSCLACTVYAAQETFGSNFTLYIVNQGVISRARGKLCVLTPGAVWGEEHLLLTVYWLLQENTAHSLTFSEVLTLARKDFDLAVHEFPEVQPRMRKHFVWTVLVRGIIYESRVRLERQNTQELNKSATNMFGERQFASERSAGSDHMNYHENLRQRRNSRLHCRDLLTRAGSKESSAGWRAETPCAPIDSQDNTKAAPKAARPEPCFPSCTLAHGASPPETVIGGAGTLNQLDTRVSSALTSLSNQQAEILKKLDDLGQHICLVEARFSWQEGLSGGSASNVPTTRTLPIMPASCSSLPQVPRSE